MKVSIEVELPDDYSAETYKQVDKFTKVLATAVTVFAAKQESYGRHNIAQFGARGVLIRLHDKVQRLINMLFNERKDKVERETLADTWMDVGNYGFIGLLCFLEEW